MKKHPYDSFLGNTFREVSGNQHSLISYFYGYIEFQNGILEIRKPKASKQKFYDLHIVKNNYIRKDLFKTVSSYNEIKLYVKELEYEDQRPLIKLLQNLL